MTIKVRRENTPVFLKQVFETYPVNLSFETLDEAVEYVFKCDGANGMCGVIKTCKLGDCFSSSVQGLVKEKMLVLENEIASLRKSKNLLEQENQFLANKKTYEFKKLQECRERVRVLQKQLKIVEDSKQDLLEQYETMRREREFYEENPNNDQLRVRMELEREIRSLENNERQLKTQLELLQINYDKDKKNWAALKQKYDLDLLDMEQRAKKMKTDDFSSQNIILKLNQDLSDLEKRHESEINMMKSQNDQLKYEFEKSRIELLEVKKNLSDAEEIIEDIEIRNYRNAEQSDQLNALQLEKDNLLKKILDLEEELRANNQKYMKMERDFDRERERLKRELAESIRLTDSRMQTQLDEKESMNRQLREEIEKLKIEKRTWDDADFNYKNTIKAKSEEILELKEKLEKDLEKIRSLEQLRDKNDSEIDRLNKLVLKLEGENQEKILEKQKLQTEYLKSKKEFELKINDLNVNIANLNAQLGDRMDFETSIETNVQNLNRIIEEKDEQIKQLKASLQEKTTDLNKVNDILKERKEKLASLKRRFENYVSQMKVRNEEFLKSNGNASTLYSLRDFGDSFLRLTNLTKVLNQIENVEALPDLIFINKIQMDYVVWLRAELNKLRDNMTDEEKAHKTTLNTMSGKLFKLEQELKKMNKERVDSEKECVILSEQISSIEKELNQVKSQKDYFQNEFTMSFEAEKELQKKYDSVLTQLENMKNEFDDEKRGILQKMYSLETDHSLLQNEIRSKNNQIEALKLHVSELEIEKGNLLSKLNALEFNQKQLRDEASSLQLRIKTLEAEKLEDASKIQVNKDEIAALRQQLKDVNSIVLEKSSDSASTSALYVEERKKNKQLENQLNNERIKLANSLKENGITIEKYKKEQSRLRLEINKLEGDLKACNVSYKSMSDKYEDLNSKYNESINNLKISSSKNEKLKEEIQSLRDRETELLKNAETLKMNEKSESNTALNTVRRDLEQCKNAIAEHMEARFDLKSQLEQEKSKSDGLKEQIVAMKTEKNTLLQKMSETKQQADNYSTRIDQLLKKNDDFYEKNKVLKERIDADVIRMEELENSISAQRNQLLNKDDQISQMSEERVLNKRQIENLLALEKSLRVDLQKLEDENSQLNQRLDSANQSVEMLKDRERVLNEEKENLKKNFDNLTSSLQNTTKRINEVTSSSKGYEAEVYRLRENETILNEKINEFKNLLEENALESDKISALVDENNNLKLSIESLNIEILKLKSTLEKSNNEIQKSSVQNKAMLNELNELLFKRTNEVSKLKERLSVMSENDRKEILELKSVIDKLKGDIAHLNKRAGELNVTNQQQLSKIENLIESKRELEKQYESLNNDMTDAKNRYGEIINRERSLQQQLNEALEKSVQLEKQLEDAQENIRDLENTQKSVNETISRYTKNLSDKTISESVASSNLEKAESEIIQSQVKIAELESQLESEKARIKMNNKVKAKLQKNLIVEKDEREKMLNEKREFQDSFLRSFNYIYDAYRNYRTLITLPKVNSATMNEEDMLKYLRVLADRSLEALKSMKEKIVQPTQTVEYIALRSQLVECQSNFQRCANEYEMLIKKGNALETETVFIRNQLSTLATERTQIEQQIDVLFKLLGYTDTQQSVQQKLFNVMKLVAKYKATESYYAQIATDIISDYKNNNMLIQDLKQKIEKLKDENVKQKLYSINFYSTSADLINRIDVAQKQFNNMNILDLVQATQNYVTNPKDIADMHQLLVEAKAQMTDYADFSIPETTSMEKSTTRQLETVNEQLRDTIKESETIVQLKQQVDNFSRLVNKSNFVPISQQIDDILKTNYNTPNDAWVVGILKLIKKLADTTQSYVNKASTFNICGETLDKIKREIDLIENSSDKSKFTQNIKQLKQNVVEDKNLLKKMHESYRAIQKRLDNLSE